MLFLYSTASFLFFFLDCMQFFIMGNILLFLVASLYSAALIKQQLSLIVLSSFLLCLEYSLIFNSPFIWIVWAIPITIEYLAMKHYFQFAILLPFVTTFTLVTIHQLIINQFLFGIFYPKQYTFIQLFGNIIVNLCFFLKLLKQGRQGNRL